MKSQPLPAARLVGRFSRIHTQLCELFQKTPDPTARMATAVALLHHKLPHFFWTGFYRLIGEDLIVGPYQGPLACSVLQRGKGVCWACLREDRAMLVADVHQFPDHIACDARSRSEVVVPVRDHRGCIQAVLDVDATRPNAFSAVDVEGLQRIADLIWGG